MNSQYLFVYGTLRRASNHEMYQLLAQHAEFFSEARFTGKLFRVSHYPGAITSDNPADVVIGEIYKLKDAAFLLEHLDDYEECSDQYPDPKEYVRERKLVRTPDGSLIETWMYLYNRPVDTLLKIQSGDFLAGILLDSPA